MSAISNPDILGEIFSFSPLSQVDNQRSVCKTWNHVNQKRFYHRATDVRFQADSESTTKIMLYEELYVPSEPLFTVRDVSGSDGKKSVEIVSSKDSNLWTGIPLVSLENLNNQNNNNQNNNNNNNNRNERETKAENLTNLTMEELIQKKHDLCLFGMRPIGLNVVIGVVYLEEQAVNHFFQLLPRDDEILMNQTLYMIDEETRSKMVKGMLGCQMYRLSDYINDNGNGHQVTIGEQISRYRLRTLRPLKTSNGRVYAKYSDSIRLNTGLFSDEVNNSDTKVKVMRDIRSFINDKDILSSLCSSDFTSLKKQLDLVAYMITGKRHDCSNCNQSIEKTLIHFRKWKQFHNLRNLIPKNKDCDFDEMLTQFFQQFEEYMKPGGKYETIAEISDDELNALLELVLFYFFEKYSSDSPKVVETWAFILNLVHDLVKSGKCPPALKHNIWYVNIKRKWIYKMRSYAEMNEGCMNHIDNVCNRIRIGQVGDNVLLPFLMFQMKSVQMDPDVEICVRMLEENTKNIKKRKAFETFGIPHFAKVKTIRL